LPEVSLFKVGMQLYYGHGPRVVEEIGRWGGRVFLDLKLHDIPHTVSEAVRVLARLGVAMLTVHASGGREMLSRAVEAAREEAALAGLPAPVLLGVTVLTSLGQGDLAELGYGGQVRDLVVRLARLALQAGCGGVVASAREARVLRLAFGPDLVIVAAGIRPAWSGVDDQQRVMTPREALKAGVTHLVVGRPVTQAPDPRAALRRLLAELQD
ncbi:MAG: orotidine-5'-phosphate decarboxylase, partial [Clostridia bacterium]|nr:orotidine-5'-phosphate decarboxylase [Clostridia bacterium]